MFISTKNTPLMKLHDNINQKSNMSNSSQNSKTYFILNNTWNIFYYVFRIFGVYPCIRDEENNELKPRSTFCIWAQYICTYLIVNSIFTWIPASYIAFIETTPNEYQENLYDIIFQSNITAMAMICNFANYSFLCLFCLHNLRNLSIGLSEFQNYFNSHTQIILNEEKITAHMQKQHLYTLMYVLVNCCGLTLFYIFVSLELNLSLVSAILYIFGSLITTVPWVIPIMYFILIYFELITFLSTWCAWIKNVQDDYSFIKETKIFIDGLDLINNIFSHFLFSIVSAFLVFLVIIAYNLFATLWDRNDFNSWQFYTMASVLHLFTFIILLYVLCTLSESMAKKVKLQHFKLFTY